jgi:hypothetical protein
VKPVLAPELILNDMPAVRESEPVCPVGLGEPDGELAMLTVRWLVSIQLAVRVTVPDPVAGMNVVLALFALPKEPEPLGETVHLSNVKPVLVPALMLNAVPTVRERESVCPVGLGEPDGELAMLTVRWLV